MRINPNHIKSLGRRGTARYYLDKLSDAQSDFKEVLKLENNKSISEYLSKVNDKLVKIKYEAYEKMSRRATFIDATSKDFAQ